MLLPKGHKANQTKLFQAMCYARKWKKMASHWLMSPETGSETFLKGQITLSEVLGRQRFNRAVSCAIVACTKRELKAAIFKTSGRPI